MSSINSGNVNRDLGTRLKIDTQRSRQTEKTDFGSKLKEGLSKTADVALAAGNIAAPFLPGGSVVSAAISGVAQLKDAAGGASSGLSGIGGGASSNSMMVGGNGSASGSTGSSGSTAFQQVDKLAAGGDSQAQMFNATKQMQEMSQGFNMQYLQLQQDMQNENRQFTLVSNIMKVKHDTAKSAINNVR